MTTWTRVTDPDAVGDLLPAWFSSRMMGSRGSYGFLLATGDVARVSRVTAVHASSAGSILIDVLLDHAGVPDGVDTAWRYKQFLGAPAPGATFATLNLAQVVMVIEFTAAEFAETTTDADLPASDAVLAELSVITDAVTADGAERTP